MTKEDFLSELRSSLSGSVSADVINENIYYYENFINTEIRKGRDEDTVLEELGSPRLLAKTIIDTAPEEERRTVNNDPDEADGSGRDTFVMPWWMIIAVIFAVMIVIFLIASIASAVLPVLIAAAVILFVIKILSKDR